jgi:uncharacterized protein (DUF305 family)
MKAWLPASLLLAVAFLLAACGDAGGGQQGSGSGGGMAGMDHGSMDGGKKDGGGGMKGMDHGSIGGMDHGGMSSGNMSAMSRQMVMPNGEYSDKAFIDAMVPHHQGAIAMAKVALGNAEHEQIKELSRNIISSQQGEIEELKSIKKEEFGTSNVPMQMSPQQMRGMGMMMNPRHLAQSKPFDKAFIDAMIPHHQSAIYMAQVAHEESKIPAIKELAENIVSAQKREIEQMKQWRKQWYS